MIETVEITKLLYFNLLKDEEILNRLIIHGVDNWEYYGEAIHGENNEESMVDWSKRIEQEVWHKA